MHHVTEAAVVDVRWCGELQARSLNVAIPKDHGADYRAGNLNILIIPTCRVLPPGA